jgi:predicted regulator of Ras-like GTPase activity (Roadblock/LC7/MglB family)
MLEFPQLVEEDFEKLRATLADLLTKSGAMAALLVEKAGYLIVAAGELKECDPSQLATLSANAYAATQFIANLIGDNSFSCMFQQGENMSVLWKQIDETCLVVVVFPAKVSVGFVRYCANSSSKLMEEQLSVARSRAPSRGLDLCNLNPRDVSEVFRMKDPGT